MRNSKSKVQAAFHEVYENEPSAVASTRKKFGGERARKQKVAIALSKARKAGAKVRTRPSGSGPMRDESISQGYRHLGKC